MFILQHLQLLDLTDQVLTQLTHMTVFGQATKYINHPKLMPKLHETETKTSVNNNIMIIKIKINSQSHINDLLETVSIDKLKSNVYRYLL